MHQNLLFSKLNKQVNWASRTVRSTAAVFIGCCNDQGEQKVEQTLIIKGKKNCCQSFPFIRIAGLLHCYGESKYITTKNGSQRQLKLEQ